MKRPLVRTDVRAHLGEAQESEDFAASQDLTFTPGYSDKRKAFDRGRAEGKKMAPLPFRLQLVRVRNSMGGLDGRGAAGYRAQGYREVKASDMEGMGISMPVGGQLSTDGFVDVGDTRLFVCDAHRAARNEMNWRRATDEAQATDRAPALEAEGRKHARPGEESLTFAEGTYSDATEDTPT
ncbi:MAG: hypothetical protein V2A73_01635 [Pseudomonadota bacterium]